MKKFKVIKMPDPNHRKNNAYFLECERDVRPFVIIRQKTKYCEVHWDFISMTGNGYSFKPDEELNGRIKVIMDKYWRLKRSYWFYGPVASIPRLTIEEAEAAAVEIYDELAKCKVRYR